MPMLGAEGQAFHYTRDGFRILLFRQKLQSGALCALWERGIAPGHHRERFAKLRAFGAKLSTKVLSLSRFH